MPDRRIVGILWAVAVTIVATTLRVLATGRVAYVGIDDANIYFTYVKHALQGHGITFAPGGAPVEGITSLAWWALLTAAQSVSPFSLDTTSLLLSATMMVGVLALVYHTIARTHPGLALPTILLVAAMPGMADWLCLSRMETGLWTLVVLAASVRVTMDDSVPRVPTAVVLALLPLVRPEGYVLAPLLAVIGALRMSSRQGAGWSAGDVVRRSVALAAAPLLVIAAVILWRWLTFGVPLPMTYYAKVSASPIDNVADGWQYLLRSLLSGGWVPLLVLGATTIRRRHLKITAWPLVITAWLVIQPILSGGDHFMYGRFFVPAYVFAWVIIMSGFGVQQPSQRLRWFGVALLLAAQMIAVSSPPWTNALRHEYAIARDGRIEADLIMTVHGTNHLPVWGVTSAGGTSYEYTGRCIDLLGLNNPAMAMATPYKRGTVRNHASFSVDVFLAQAPDVLWVFGAATDSAASALADSEWAVRGAQRRMLRGLVEDPRFTRLYAFGRIDGNGQAYYGIVRRAWIASAASGSVRFEPLQTRTFVF